MQRNDPYLNKLLPISEQIIRKIAGRKEQSSPDSVFFNDLVRRSVGVMKPNVSKFKINKQN